MEKKKMLTQPVMSKYKEFIIATILIMVGIAFSLIETKLLSVLEAQDFGLVINRLLNELLNLIKSFLL